MNRLRAVTLIDVACLMAVLLGAPACRHSEVASKPVAAPSVTFRREWAPLGGAIDATYRFVVPDGAAVDADYKVFVHFLDKNGGLMWTDDHDPPVPTSRWRGTVEYTRAVFIPVYPYVGDAVVQVGLYVSSTNARVQLAGEDMGGRAYRAGRLRIAPQTDGVVTLFGEGWYQPEGPPATEWRWTKKEAALLFQNRGTACALYIDADNPFQPGQARQVALSVAGRAVARFDVPPGGQVRQKIPLSLEQMGTEDPGRLLLSVDNTIVPHRQSTSNADERDLGIRVFHLAMDPVDHSLPAK